MMAAAIATGILILTAIYLSCGVLFIFFFFRKGLHAIDEGTQGASAGFKIIIIPGVIVFWPLLLKKWMKAAGEQKNCMPAEKKAA
jgi:hypothetical protein